MVMLTIISLLLGAYLLGCFPTGYLVARRIKGIDIRQHGSGSTGATNVLRTVGKGPALLVFAVDLLKGSLAVLLIRWGFSVLSNGWGVSAEVLSLQPWLATLAGLLAMVGHSRSLWLGFSGGKSVATGLGVLLGLAWPVALISLGVFALSLGLSQFVSLSSMLAAICTPVLMALTNQPLPYFLLAILGATYIVLRHRRNIERLLAGTEPRLGQPSSTPKSDR